jgi:hypothetical protein
MLATILVSGLLAVVPAATAARSAAQDPDPAIRLSMSRDGAYVPGQWARVHVRAARDGYLVVVQSDPQGRVRVLFPVDPVDDPFIPGQREFEIRSRGDRDAFQVESDLGTGVVLAAWSPDPFVFGDFRRGERWDLRALEIPASELDLERGLTDLVSRMAPPGGFDYDVLRYTVAEEVYASSGGYYGGTPTCFGCDPWGSSVYVSIGRSWYDPWWYDPWYYRPWYGYDPGYYYPYYYYPYRYYPVYHPYPRPYASYPYSRNRYGWKAPVDAVASDRPGYRDRYTPGFRDRALDAPSVTPDAGTRRRLPSIGERERQDPTGFGTRRRVTGDAATTPQRGGETGRRTTGQPEARPAQPEKSREVETPRRRTPTPPEARPAEPEKSREAETPRRRTPTPPEARPAEPRKDQPSGGRRATPASTSGETRASATRRRSESVATPARAATRPVDARRQASLPSDARAVASARRSAERPELRPASARRTERPVSERGTAVRGTPARDDGSRRAVESRPVDRPSPSASRGGNSGGSPRAASPARGEGGGRASAPSGGGGGRASAPSGGGGSRGSAPSGGGGGRRR